MEFVASLKVICWTLLLLQSKTFGSAATHTYTCKQRERTGWLDYIFQYQNQVNCGTSACFSTELRSKSSISGLGKNLKAGQRKQKKEKRLELPMVPWSEDNRWLTMAALPWCFWPHVTIDVAAIQSSSAGLYSREVPCGVKLRWRHCQSMEARDSDHNNGGVRSLFAMEDSDK